MNSRGKQCVISSKSRVKTCCVSNRLRLLCFPPGKRKNGIIFPLVACYHYPCPGRTSSRRVYRIKVSRDRFECGIRRLERTRATMANYPNSRGKRRRLGDVRCGLGEAPRVGPLVDVVVAVAVVLRWKSRREGRGGSIEILQAKRRIGVRARLVVVGGSLLLRQGRDEGLERGEDAPREGIGRHERRRGGRRVREDESIAQARFHRRVGGRRLRDYYCDCYRYCYCYDCHERRPRLPDGGARDVPHPPRWKFRLPSLARSARRLLLAPRGGGEDRGRSRGIGGQARGVRHGEGVGAQVGGFRVPARLHAAGARGRTERWRFRVGILPRGTRAVRSVRRRGRVVVSFGWRWRVGHHFPALVVPRLRASSGARDTEGESGGGRRGTAIVGRVGKRPGELRRVARPRVRI
mmetsp:Transcript_21168/g.44123  ORF Transcript_21168/g.44123 Transcript_21168/m.44123 type:complete len:407 (+) Transcript_21168:103-1323(+)